MAVNKCVKYLLFLFNLLFWISGCVILGVAIYLKVNKDGNRITAEAVPGIDLLIAIGVIIMVLGFLGCCGAIRENRCLLLLFFIGLLLILILLLAAGILGAVGDKKAEQWLKERLQTMLPLGSQPAAVQTDLQNMEVEAKCCGLINGPQDWGSTIPSSCNCVDKAKNCTTTGGRQVYSTPCITFVTTFMKNNAVVVLGIAFGLAVLMLFGMAFAMALYCQIGKGDAGAV